MKVLFVGAHPDDPDYHAGGLAKKYTNASHEVRFLSMTNGDMGHQEMRGPTLAERRRREAFMASGIGGLEYVILNNRDGRLFPTLELRDELIGLIRQFDPDLILTHRPNDYHPDHRYTSMLVQDAAYLLTVPGISAKTPYLRRMPVICYMEDDFQKPIPFQPDVVISIDDTVDAKIRMLDAHASQFYEWLPFNQGVEGQVPKGAEQRLAWLGGMVKMKSVRTADRFRQTLKALYGENAGAAVRYAEALEVCEYGQRLTDENRGTLFPFFSGQPA